MRSLPILTIGAALGASMMRIRPLGIGRRVRQSKYVPHQGAKERERAKRCWMQPFHGPMSDYSPNLRSTSVMHQMSKRHTLIPKYEA